MYIESIDIVSFGGLRNLKLELSDGVSIIEGGNESGKSTIAAFIKFMLYGFADKTERTVKLSWDSSAAEGSMVIRCADGRYRIGRRYRDGRDDCQITELVGNTLCHKGRQPGEVFLGVSAEVFSHTAYVSQLEGGKINGEEISSAIGNMLFSADETLNVQRAQKRLEDERVGLWHKSRKGGRIYELEAERDALLERRKNASADVAAIISKEGQLADFKIKIKENVSKIDRFSKIFAAYDVKQRTKRRATLEELRERVQKLADERKLIVASYTSNGFFPDDKYISELNQLRQGLQYIEKRLGELEAEAASSGTKVSDIELPEAVKLLRKHGGREMLMDNYEIPKTKRSLRIAFGIICGILFIPMTVIAISFLLVNYTFGVVFILVALLLMFGLVMSFISSVKYTRAVDELLDEFGAEGNADFKRIVDEAALFVEPHSNDGNLMLLEGERAKLNVQRDTKLNELKTLLGRWGGRTPDLALSDLADFTAKIKSNEIESEKAAAELAGAQSQRDGDTAEDDENNFSGVLSELAARLPDDINITAIKREQDFLIKANASMSARQHELEIELAQLYTKTDSPSQLADRITALESELVALHKRYDAVELAAATLNNASETMRDGVSPKLSEYAGRIIEIFSGGKYSTVAVASDLSMSYDAGTGAITRHGIEYMSAGTQDIAYLSLRMALINLMYRREFAPLVFDESFTRLDDTRLRNVLRLLTQVANAGTQVIIFTAQTREYNIMSYSVRHIKL